MDILSVMIATLPYSLSVAPFLVGFAIAVAFSGSKYSVRGAALTAASFYFVCVLMMVSMQSIWLAWWKHFLTYSIVAGIPLAIVFVPMLAARNLEWMRGRLIAGLIGAAFAIFIFFYFAHSVICGLLGDCL